jgi:hypothetical protein
MIPRFWYRWLVVATVGLMAFGIAMVVAPGIAKFGFSALIYTDGHFISTSFSPQANGYVALVHGVLGAVLVGWGLQIFLVIKGPFLKAQPTAWSSIAIPLAVWFVIDTSFSILAGYRQNAVLNTGLLAVFAIPLGATRKHFGGHARNPRASE